MTEDAGERLSLRGKEGWSVSLGGFDCEVGGLRPVTAVYLCVLGVGQRIMSMVLISETISSYLHRRVKRLFGFWAGHQPLVNTACSRFKRRPPKRDERQFCLSSQSADGAPGAALGSRNIRNESLRRVFTLS